MREVRKVVDALVGVQSHEFTKSRGEDLSGDGGGLSVTGRNQFGFKQIHRVNQDTPIRALQPEATALSSDVQNVRGILRSISRLTLGQWCIY
jgi:hypothetical protein